MKEEKIKKFKDGVIFMVERYSGSYFAIPLAKDLEQDIIDFTMEVSVAVDTIKELSPDIDIKVQYQLSAGVAIFEFVRK